MIGLESDRYEQAKKFASSWLNRGDEKSGSQTFWLELLHDVLDVESPGDFIEFEKGVALSHKSYIDAYIPSTKILIEQKGINTDLTKAALQSDGTYLTPFEQAKRYRDWLPASEQGRWIITCNFQEFRVHDLEFPRDEPEIILLKDLEAEWQKLLILVNTNAKTPKQIREQRLSEEAGKLINKFYECIAPRYKESKSQRAKESLNILCTRLVFLLYAEDSGIFRKNAFHDFLDSRKNTARTSLLELFNVLNTEEDKRDSYLEDDLKAFRFINGGLFEQPNIEIPKLDGEPLRIILEDMSESFNWSSISPTIFGAIFESTLNDETRSEGGMHYTMPENIHKVINPLFMDELNQEFNNILEDSKSSSRVKKLIALQDKLSQLTFLDPACGSGNFLTETFIMLRRLENKIIAELSKSQKTVAEGLLTPIKVLISQFYGIEINDFAVNVAKTALYITEHQMRKETEAIIEIQDDYLPLRHYTNIIRANAINYHWDELIKPERLNYIISNPPFSGHQWRTPQQKLDMKAAFHDLGDSGKFDYVCAWYNKALDFIRGTGIKAVFVSTNSICQGESVNSFWKFLTGKGADIFLAYRPFIWESKAEDKAHVHCVIVGITHGDMVRPKYIFSSPENFSQANHINGWLLDAPDVYLQNRGSPLLKHMPRMRKGSQPTGKDLILSPDERLEIIAKYPEADRFIRRYMSGRDFLYNNIRYCIWLEGVEPGEFRHIKPFRERFERVKEARLKSSTKSVKEAADTPYLFTQNRQPESQNFMVVPEVTSENRRYVPMGFMTPEIVVSNKLYIIPDADLFMFGVLESRVHTEWVDVVAGRLGMSYSYAPFVYNNFPWPSVSHDSKQRSKIISCAQRILEVRNKFPASTLADLYDPLYMPPELRHAHKINDSAVCEAYGFSKDIRGSDIVNELMKRYQELAKQ